MIKIAHRGNISGPDKKNENSPRKLEKALALGFDVEVDIWAIDNKLYLGHDAPTYSTDLDFINKIKSNSWFHCKNLQAILAIAKVEGTKYFWHQEDDYTLTSNNYIWTYPGKDVTSRSIIVLTEKVDFELYEHAYGICSDYLL